jgi:hypothetical protein
MIKHLPSKMLQELSSAIGRVLVGSQLAGFSIAAHNLKIHCEQAEAAKTARYHSWMLTE